MEATIFVLAVAFLIWALSACAPVKKVYDKVDTTIRKVIP
jgi:hypothetical protein